jgi:hypothetical protein
MSGVKFSSGSVYITPGAMEQFTASGDDPLAFLIRHLAGDWGEVTNQIYVGNCGCTGNGSPIGSVTVISDPPEFTVVPSLSSATVTAGQSGTFTLTVTPQGSFTNPAHDDGDIDGAVTPEPISHTP